MRIIVDGIPRTVGGIGSLILNLAEFSKAAGDGDKITFEFIISVRSAYVPILEEKGYAYHVAPAVSEVGKYRRFVEKLFSENAYDYLWFNNTSKVNLILPSAAKRRDVKVIAHTHGVNIEETGVKRLAFQALNRLNRRRMFSLIDVPLACSGAAADVYYAGSRALREQTAIITNGIETERFRYSAEKRRALRAEMGLGEREILLGAVGRLTAVKNYPLIIRMLSALDDRYRLIILGVGEDQAALQALIEELGLQGRCSLLGKRENVPDYLSAMDYFLIPSINEGMPFSVIEAQCAGLPCLVADTLTREVAITDRVRFLPIDGSEVWAKAIREGAPGGDREAYAPMVAKAGYSIEETYRSFIMKL